MQVQYEHKDGQLTLMTWTLLRHGLVGSEDVNLEVNLLGSLFEEHQHSLGVAKGQDRVIGMYLVRPLHAHQAPVNSFESTACQCRTEKSGHAGSVGILNRQFTAGGERTCAAMLMSMSLSSTMNSFSCSTMLGLPAGRIEILRDLRLS